MFDILVYFAYLLRRFVRVLGLVLLVGLLWLGWHFFLHSMSSRAPVDSVTPSASPASPASPAVQPAVPPVPSPGGPRLTGPVRRFVDAASAAVDDCWQSVDPNARATPPANGAEKSRESGGAVGRFEAKWMSRSLCIGRRMSAWLAG